MFDVNKIKSKLIGLNGWRQNTDPSGWLLLELTASISGMYYNEVHPILTIDNLISAAPDYALQYNSAAEINVAFTNWLKQKTEAGIVRAIDSWRDHKAEIKTAKTLLERRLLFQTSTSFNQLEPIGTKVVGLEILPSRSLGVITKIPKIGLQFDTTQEITVQLFKAGEKNAVEKVDLNYTGSGSIQWFTVNFELQGATSYFIAYDQAEITGQAINGTRHYDSHNAGTIRFPTGKFFSVSAFSTLSSFDELWDIKTNSYTTATNYGINLDMSVYCDYTDLIIDQMKLFQSVVLYEVGMDLMREIAFNAQSRVNRNLENISKADILYEINGDTQGRNDSTVWGRYIKALNAINFDRSNIDKVCLPCRKKGVRIKPIGPGA